MKNVAYAAKNGGGTIASVKEVDALAPGAIAIFSVENNTLITAATPVATIARHKEFYLVLGQSAASDGTLRTRRSQPFKEYAINPIPMKLPYEAPTKQKSFIGSDGTVGNLNLPTTLIPDTYITIKVYDRTDALPNFKDWFSVVYRIKSGDTPANIVAKLVIEINKKNKIVTATAVGTTGIQLDGKNFGQLFEVVTDDVLIDADILYAGGVSTVAVAPKSGNGAPVNLIAYENYLSPKRGNTNKMYISEAFYSVGSEVDTTATYDIYNIVTDHHREVSSMRDSTQVKSIMIACPVGATAQANLETIIALLFPAAVLQI